MPGHKGLGMLGVEALDLTEVKGADSLYEAEGIIAESEANAAKLFGSRRTFYSAGGSSQSIRAMCLLACQHCCVTMMGHRSSWRGAMPTNPLSRPPSSSGSMSSGWFRKWITRYAAVPSLRMDSRCTWSG